MTVPANIRVNIGAPFPATVKGSGPISVAKKNGIWTVALNYLAFGQAQNVPDPSNTYVLVFDPLTNVYTLIPMAAVAGTKVVKILTGVGNFASPYAALPGDDVLIVKQGAANAFTVTVDWSKRAKPLTVVGGDTIANFANISVTPTAGQTQMATVNHSYVIKSSGGSITLTPLPDGSGAY